MCRRGVLFVVLSLLLLPTLAGAQTKMSGTAQCDKPDPQYAIQVGDRPDHSFAISQLKCTWTNPFEIAGTQAKDGVSTEFANISGNSSRSRGYHVGTMTDGNNYHVRYKGSATLEDGALQSSEGTWKFVGGTGKLKGLKGHGTYKCRAAGEGTTCDVEGEYQLPK